MFHFVQHNGVGFTGGCRLSVCGPLPFHDQRTVVNRSGSAKAIGKCPKIIRAKIDGNDIRFFTFTIV